MKKLEVGDVIYSTCRGDLQNKHTVIRVTKTKAVAGSIEFRREYSGVSARKKIRNQRSVDIYYIETKDLKERWRRKQILDNINLIGIDKLPTTTLELILTNLRS